MRTDQPTVSEVMEREVATLREDEHMDLAEDVMRLGRVRHMPVLEGDRVIGIVSQRDLLAASLSKALTFDPAERRTFLRSIEVKEVMSRDVKTIPPDAKLHEAAQRMLRYSIGCLPVVQGDRFLGLVTETDLLRAAFLEGGARRVATEAEESERGGARRERLERELDELRRLRDELRVQVHLGKAEAKDLWERLEQRWSELEAQLQRLARRAEEPLSELGETARRVVGEIRDGYRRLRKLL